MKMLWYQLNLSYQLLLFCPS